MRRYCRSVLEYEFQRPAWRFALRVHKVLHTAAEYILGTAFTALVLWLIYMYVPIASNKRWTAIVALGLVIVLLGWFIRAAKRFHFAAVDANFKAADQINSEYAASNAQVELWTLFKGRYDGLYSLLELRRWQKPNGAPLATAEIEYLEADLRNMIHDHCGGAHGVEDWFERLGVIPETIQGQVDRLTYHRHRLEALIKAQKGHHLAINDKAQWQRKRIIEGGITEVIARLVS